MSRHPGPAQVDAAAPQQQAAGETAVVDVLLIAGIALAGLLVPLNSTMLAVALPKVMADLNEGPSNAGWLITSYLITMACAQPIAGGLGDRLGRRKVMLAGLVGAGIASLAAALSQDLVQLAVCRLAQALSGALVVPNSAAIIRERVPSESRGQVIGMMGAAIGIGAAGGPPLGGLLTEIGNWRAIFLVNLPLVAVALTLSLMRLPRDPVQRRGRGFDWRGAVLLAVVLATAAYVAQQAGRGVTPTLGAALAAVLLTGGGLLWLERRQPHPVLDPAFFASRTFSAANAGIALANLAMYCTLLVVPQYLAATGHDSAIIGFSLIPLSLSMVLFAPWGGRLSDKVGRRWPVALGVGLQTVGALSVLLLGRSDQFVLLVAGLGLMGVGLGFAQSGLQSAAMEAAPVAQAGAAAGVFSTSRYFGSIVGTSLLAALLQAAGGPEDGFHAVLLLVVTTAAAATLAALFIEDWPEQQRGPQH